MQEVRRLPLLTITASVPQLACKQHSASSIIQDFSPQPLMHGPWPLEVLPLLHPLPGIPQGCSSSMFWALTQCFSCSGNTPCWSQGKCVMWHLNTDVPAEITVTGTLQPPSILRKWWDASQKRRGWIFLPYALASNPEHCSCPRSDHFIVHTQQHQKQATKSKLFACSWRLVLLKWQHSPLWGGGEVALSASSWSV